MGGRNLKDNYWTLHAAAGLRYTGVPWPKPYWPGRDQLNRLKARGDMQIGKV
jgi:anthraniloyl-CoA monooxygenase